MQRTSRQNKNPAAGEMARLIRALAAKADDPGRRDPIHEGCPVTHTHMDTQTQK